MDLDCKINDNFFCVDSYIGGRWLNNQEKSRHFLIACLVAGKDKEEKSNSSYFVL